MSADPIFTDGHYARYQAELEATEDRLLAIERRASEISGEELQQHAFDILYYLDELANRGSLGARELIVKLMKEGE